MSKVDKKLLLQKMLVGHFIENIPEDCTKKVCYVLQGDGLWERRINKLGTFDTHVQKFSVPGLKSDMEEGWELNVPRIPAKILVQIVSFFRKINKMYDSEVFVQVFYDTEKEEYFATVPEQTVSGASVSYNNDASGVVDRNHLLVFEIHSHNTMDAFFSGVDDADEKDDRFYGVIGRITQYFPKILIRLSLGGRKEMIDVEDLFDIEGSETYTDSFPAEWLSRVKKQQFTVRTYRGNRKVYTPIGSAYAQRQVPLFGSDEEDGEVELAEEGTDDDNISDWRDSFYPDKPPADEGDDSNWPYHSNDDGVMSEEDEIPDLDHLDPRKVRF